ncbi:type III secretion system inner rod subunit SctI [Burkholderia ubonensis]|uniref:type III secretion system inner rod subunit SctI n=1 Tax=Burkholderia ubonensis TaxID=101571 RepID=UPI00075CAE0B|nr:type III secretion system inner rod subunit SctI [Burkholderia ubonensis]KVD63243.1 type III secretion system protein PrgJ [Burkholderia ubonensis]KVP48683.1 type III secretion system protein PrgJ [Burkholderia ubonensis]KVR42589.1 type III secretion system protein PrgJ [Burkholderia ubonensis]KVU30877.1 type III secretion system protein PrgJ [Burkholderia ubonensis]KVW31010.1 type III secretion system protein PrgJ [Burkholderia ubonensis]
MQNHSIKPVEALVSRIRELPAQENDIVSLDDRLVQAFSQSAVSVNMEKDAIMQRLEQRNVVTDPAELFQLQLRTSNYNLEVSTISTLTRKAVSAVEYLMRS